MEIVITRAVYYGKAIALSRFKPPKTARVLQMSSAKTFGLIYGLFAKILYEVCMGNYVMQNHKSTAFLGVLWVLSVQSTPRKAVDSVLVQRINVPRVIYRYVGALANQYNNYIFKVIVNRDFIQVPNRLKSVVIK